MQKESQINHENIAKLMDIFYAKIRIHEHLGPIFNAVITTDKRWESHKKHIASFWRSMLLGENSFQGQPLKKHLDLPPFPRERFGEWLELFEESLNEIYEQEVAIAILQRAQMIAQNFQRAIYEFPH